MSKLFAAAAVAAAIALALRPDLRRALSAEWNDPTRLPALESDPRVRFEPAARECAERVAALLPGAMARIEAAQGRPFARPPIVGVYHDFETYAEANGLGDGWIAGVSRAGRALLSPTLCVGERPRLEGVLTHELSHVHFFGALPRGAKRPPQWFTEGLAVWASNGGAAERVSDAEAKQAIRDGYAVILDESPWMDFSAIRFAREPEPPAGFDAYSYRQRLAFRQAALFIGSLRDKDPAAFTKLLRDLERGASFNDAVSERYKASPDELWRAFAERQSG
ncbi:MAG: hypothetical protein N2444_07815 [Methylocystis sp.]|nr:hypothetical protein [Methylocystis sp.]